MTRWRAVEWAAFMLGWISTGLLAETGWRVGASWVLMAGAVGYFLGAALERKAAR